nr:hypothetical protein [Salmonid herpesvirus 1]
MDRAADFTLSPKWGSTTVIFDCDRILGDIKNIFSDRQTFWNALVGRNWVVIPVNDWNRNSPNLCHCAVLDKVGERPDSCYVEMLHGILSHGDGARELFQQITPPVAAVCQHPGFTVWRLYNRPNYIDPTIRRLFTSFIALGKLLNTLPELPHLTINGEPISLIALEPTPVGDVIEWCAGVSCVNIVIPPHLATATMGGSQPFNAVRWKRASKGLSVIFSQARQEVG